MRGGNDIEMTGKTDESTDHGERGVIRKTKQGDHDATAETAEGAIVAEMKKGPRGRAIKNGDTDEAGPGLEAVVRTGSEIAGVEMTLERHATRERLGLGIAPLGRVVGHGHLHILPTVRMRINTGHPRGSTRAAV